MKRFWGLLAASLFALLLLGVQSAHGQTGESGDFVITPLEASIPESFPIQFEINPANSGVSAAETLSLIHI